MTKIDINVSAMGLRVSVFGAGYVGCVSAACLSNDGFRVVAVDPDSFKVSCLARGEAPIIEPDLAEFLEKANLNGMLTATTSAEDAVEKHKRVALLRRYTQPSRRHAEHRLRSSGFGRDRPCLAPQD